MFFFSTRGSGLYAFLLAGLPTAFVLGAAFLAAGLALVAVVFLTLVAAAFLAGVCRGERGVGCAEREGDHTLKR